MSTLPLALSTRRGVPKLVAKVAPAQPHGEWIELVVPRGLTATEFRKQIVEGEWTRQWLQTVDGDWINLNHVWVLSVVR